MIEHIKALEKKYPGLDRISVSLSVGVPKVALEQLDRGFFTANGGWGHLHPGQRRLSPKSALVGPCQRGCGARAGCARLDNS